MKTNQDLLEIAWQATQIGAKTLGSSQPSAVQHKGDRDLVTDIDLAIQDDIAAYLAQTTPDIQLLAEESQHHPSLQCCLKLFGLKSILILHPTGIPFVELIRRTFAHLLRPWQR